jgi:arylsulfatase A-like enzyme
MNVLVIVTDSMRVDHIGCYGGRARTPAIDRLAREGVRFTQAYGDNFPTLPMRLSWWTGKYHFHEAGWQPFTDRDLLLAEVLWDRGFSTALVTDTYHMHKPVYNCGRGFDTTVFVRGQEYDPWIVDPAVPADVAASPVHRLRHGDDRESDELWTERYAQYLRNSSVRRSEEDYCAPRVVRQAARWLEQAARDRRQPFFLWVDLFDPHEPWDPPPPYNRMYTDPSYRGPDLVDPVPGEVSGYLTSEELQRTRDLYAGEVSFVDAWVGVLLDRLEALGLGEDTVVIHTSDHGEPFGEHGYVRKARPWSYQELAHIPWTIRLPDRRGAGRVVDALVQSVDMMPTILDLLGVESDKLMLTFTEPDQSGRASNIFPQDLVTRREHQVLSGRSVLPLVRGGAAKLRDIAFGGHHNREWFARDARWTYLLSVDGSRAPELYDRTADPGETRNLASEHPEISNGFELELRRFADSLPRSYA